MPLRERPADWESAAGRHSCKATRRARRREKTPRPPPAHVPCSRSRPVPLARWPDRAPFRRPGNTRRWFPRSFLFLRRLVRRGLIVPLLQPGFDLIHHLHVLVILHAAFPGPARAIL